MFASPGVGRVPHPRAVDETGDGGASSDARIGRRDLVVIADVFNILNSLTAFLRSAFMTGCAVLLTVFLSHFVAASNARAADVTPQSRLLDGGRLPSIPVAVFAPPDVKDSFVDGICAETDAIWRPAGITFAWRRLASKDAVDASQLTVSIESRRLLAAENHSPLGWITFTGNEPEPSIHLSIGGVEDLLGTAEDLDDRVAARHVMLIERALGRALSHEIGHYLLGTKAHTSRGLMRANWPPREVFAEGLRGFELTPQERDVAVQRVRTERHS